MNNPSSFDFADTNRIRPTAQKRENLFNGILTNKILGPLPDSDFANLLPRLEPVSFKTGEYIYELGQSLSFVYFPESVVISQVYFLEDGSSASVSIIGSDGLLGLSALLNATKTSSWAVATIGGGALRIRADVLRAEFAKSGSLQRQILSYANSRLEQLAQRAVCNSRHRLEERLCSWLLMIHDRAKGSDLPLTHEVISQHLGSRRAGVTNFCNVLRENDVIDYQRGIIRILDRETLESSACECYRRLHKTTDPGERQSLFHDRVG